MDKLTTIAGLRGMVAAALFAVGCTESIGPEPRGPGPVQFDVAAGGIGYDQDNGAMGESGTYLIKGFNPQNPHLGDAIIATFFWLGSTNIIDSVTDHLTTSGFPPVGNKYTLVEFVTAGGISMATYVATNVQNFPDAFNKPAQDSILAVRANLSTSVQEGGVLISAYGGVAADFVQALRASHSASGSGTVADPGSVPINAGGLAYGVTLTNGQAGVERPAGFTWLSHSPSDTRLIADGDFAVQASAGTVDPRWTWGFQAPSTWLATVLTLNPGSGPPPPPPPPVASFTSSCSGLMCNFDASSSTAQATATYSWTWGDGTPAGAGKTATHTYGAAGSYNVTLTVTDGGGSNSKTQPVAVSLTNQPPTAAFTPNCSGLTCNFTNTSSDPDGSIASSQWAFGDGAVSTATSPSYTYASGGMYTVRLTVMDNQGATSSTSQNVTVGQANQPPTAAFTPNCSGLTCTFTNTSSDPDGSIASSQWDFGDGTGSTVQSPSHTYPADGSYSVVLTVTDNQGATSSTSQDVAVSQPNQPPVVDAGPDDKAVTGLLYSFSWSFSDPNNDGPWSYRIDWGDGSTSTGNASSQGTRSSEHTYFIILPRDFTIRVTVTDSHGASGSDTKVVTVLLL